MKNNEKVGKQYNVKSDLRLKVLRNEFFIVINTDSSTQAVKSVSYLKGRSFAGRIFRGIKFRVSQRKICQLCREINQRKKV